MNGALLRQLALALALLCGAAQAQVEHRLATLEPAAWRGDHPEELGPGQPARPWYALRLQGNALEITALTRKPAKQTGISRPAKPLPAGTLMVVQPFQAEADEPLKTLPGRHANALPAPALLAASWQRRVLLPAAASAPVAWALSTRVQRRPDGQLLAGSMELLAQREGSEAPLLLLPVAVNSAFQRQELLWIGMLPGGKQPSLVLRRIWLTGEEEHLALINGQWAQAVHDPDQPLHSFSSGVDEDASTPPLPRAQQRPLPMALSEAVSLRFDATAWRRALAQAEADPLVPRRFAERRATLRGEAFKVWVDYLPRFSASALESPDAPSSAPDLLWRGKLVMRVSFRGKSSVLMELGELEDSLEMRLGLTATGQPAIDMSHTPHYNNSFDRGWIWDERGGRFQRWAVHHSQGC